jgi:hypothetical protein
VHHFQRLFADAHLIAIVTPTSRLKRGRTADAIAHPGGGERFDQTRVVPMRSDNRHRQVSRRRASGTGVIEVTVGNQDLAHIDALRGNVAESLWPCNRTATSAAHDNAA